MRRLLGVGAALVVAVGALVLAQSGGAGAVALTGKLDLPDLPLTNSCAVFNKSTTDGATRIVYGENIDFDVQVTATAVLEVNKNALNLKFLIGAHGDGVGLTSGIGYVFDGKAQVKANTNDTSRFKGSFSLDARIIGKGNDASQGGIAQGAQDNAVLHWKVSINYSGPDSVLEVTALRSDFSIECSGSPWSNQMSAPLAGTKTPVGRGFGDTWNKYAWSMRDFGGGMLVGTKNAHFDYLQLADPNFYVGACFANPALQLPAIYKILACAEMYDSGGVGTDGSPAASTNRAEIWRFDYSKKTWTRVRDDAQSQGFRVMATHNNKLYAGSDLGSFVTGIELGSWNGNFPVAPTTTTTTTSTIATAPIASGQVSAAGLGQAKFDFPGTAIVSSTDGKTWSSLDCGAVSVGGPCDSKTQVPFGSDVNISIRALASFNGKLYVGTFNVAGGELWSWDGTAWSEVEKFDGTGGAPSATGVTELRVMGNKLVVGLGGNMTTNYLWTVDTSGNLAAVSGLPSAAGTLGVLKLFVNSKGNLFIGIADVSGAGFKLYSWPGGTSTSFTPITLTGFGNPENAYAWSMNEINGRLLLGTFNYDFFNELPRGSAELWYSDDGGSNWQQMALPLDWGPWNYGIRNLEIGNKQLFLGTASNMIAPDLLNDVDLGPLSGGLLAHLTPGAEVWTIKTSAVAPPSPKR